MEEEITQSFRLDGHTEILNLPCDHDGGQNFINWDTINGIYPGTQWIQNGNNVVRMLEYTGPDGNLRHRIRHQPGVVLVVVLSNSAPKAPVISPPGYSTLPPVNRQSSDTLGTSTDDNIVEVIDVDTSDTGIRVELNRHLVALLPPDIQPQLLDSSNVLESIIQGITSGLVRVDQPQLDVCLRELRGEVAKNIQLVSNLSDFAVKNNELASKNNELLTDIKRLSHKNMDLTSDVIKLQEKTNEAQEKTMDQLAQIQNSIQALMTQTYELHEYPIPRLFVILPQDTSSWNPVNLFYNKFRLYFLCECGDHTRSDNSSTPHHIHFAKHEGYEIKRPKTFIQQFGQHILTILKMLKFGFSAASVAIPGISFLMRSDALDQATKTPKVLSESLPKGIDQAIDSLDQATKTLKVLPESLPKGIDQAIDSLERGTQNDDISVVGSLDRMKSKKALEGADLRKLESFLKYNDVNSVLGNLYRTVTTEGHVKWVCLDHYRELYQEEAARDFCDTVKSLEGTFNENVGRVNILLQSKEKAEQFYQALEKARSVYELDVTLGWNATYGDFKDLRDALRKTNVGMLEIDLRYQARQTSAILNLNRRYNPIFDIMSHPSIHSIEILGIPEGSFQPSSSWKGSFPNLRHMGVDLRSDTRDIKTLLSKSPKLSSLTLNDPMAVGVLSLFRTLEPLEDLFESVGRRQLYLRSRIHLQSSMQAEQVYRALGKAKSLHELDIDLDWSTTQSDIERLSDFLTKSNVGSLKLRVNLKENLTGDVSNHVQRHDSVFDIMRRPFTLSVSIKGAPRDFIQQSSLLKQNDGFPSLRHMEIDLTELKEDVLGIKCLIVNASDLSSLILQGDIDNSILLRLYMAIAEYQTCPITIASKPLCIPPLTTAPNQSLDPHQYLAHLLSMDGVIIDQLVLEGCTGEEAILDAFAKVERSNTGLRELTLKGASEGREDQFFKNIASIASRSELDKLVIYLEGDKRHVQILESIQWKHIRDLRIRMDKECVGRYAMQALVNGRDKLKEPPRLEYFEFISFSSGMIFAEQVELLRSFVASTSLRTLVLLVSMNPSDVHLVLTSVDVSRLEEIKLRAKGSSSSRIDRILDYLQNADKLRKVHFSWYDSTQEQKERMRARGVTLDGEFQTSTRQESHGVLHPRHHILENGS